MSTSGTSRALVEWPRHLRLTLVSTYYAPVIGGIETHMRDTAKALMSAGVDVKVICLARQPGGGALPVGFANEDGVVVQRVRSFGIGDAFRWPAGLNQLESTDLIHLHGFSRLLLVKIARRRSIPLVITPHGGILGAKT